MNELLRDLVADRLSAAVDCPAKDDIIEEITADLAEQYQELLDSGLEPEEAMEQVAERIGSLDEIVSFINEANRRSEEQQKAGNTNPFAGMEDLMKQLAKDLSPSIKCVANDLRNAAGHLATAARDAARDARGPIRDMTRNAGQTIRENLKNIKLSVRMDGGRNRYDYTIPSEGINSINVQTAGGDVTFGISQDDNIYIVELSAENLSEEQLAQIQTADGTLHVRQGKKSAAGSVLFNYGIRCSDFEIYLPCRAWNCITVTTTSGDIDMEKGTELASLQLRTTSGDINCPEIQCGSCEISTISGDVQHTGHFETLNIVTVSGDCNLYGTARQLSVKSTSGDLTLQLDNMPEEMELTTVSGDIRTRLPDNDGFVLHYQRFSGDVRSDFDLKTSLNDHCGTAVYLSGANRNYSMQTVSGDLRIYRR